MSAVYVVCDAGLIPATNNRTAHAVYSTTQTGKLMHANDAVYTSVINQKCWYAFQRESPVLVLLASPGVKRLNDQTTSQVWSHFTTYLRPGKGTGLFIEVDKQGNK